ncbi:MAG: outer membrane protein assembly factor BamD [Sphingobacteriales bacterium]|nr:MAG: outer membrane protein assembly factor BamD [Sphingobacteriales bacterium]
MKLKHFFILLYMAVAAMSLPACNSYQKLLKSDDVALKFQKAEEYYNKKDYQRALPLLEDLLTYYRGSAQAEKVYYMLADTYFQMENYQLSTYQFKSFADAYPLSELAEKAYFYYAYSLYKGSPRKDLDQGNTGNAITAFQLFTSKYPDSKQVDEANKYIDELRAKLEVKAIDNAMLYYKIENYKSAVWALRQVITDFPATKQRENLEFHIIKSSYLLAERSVESKQKERYANTVQYFNEFRERYPKSAYDSELNRMIKDANSKVEKLKNNRS